jgi:hypothetical protein
MAEQFIFTYYDNDVVDTLLSQVIYDVSILIKIPLWYMLWKICKKYMNDIVDLYDLKMWLTIDCIFLSICVAFIVILNFVPENTLIAIPFCISSIITVFGCLHLMGYIARSMQTSFTLAALKLEQKHYEDKFQDEQRIRSIYHDMKNHLLLLQSYESDRKEVNIMVDSIKEQIEGYENYYHTGNSFLDVIIRDKNCIATENEIDLNIVICFAEGNFITPLDISTLFGNAIDNAIEASLKLLPAQRLITIKANCIREMLSIVFENNTVSTQDKCQKTSKKDTFLHGFGLNNIKRVVDKYDGQCLSKWENCVYTLKIIIPIPKS